MRSNLAYSAYAQNNVSIESPQKLIEMLYEGVLRFSSMAIRAIEDEDIEKRVYWINRASSIFAELINSLDYSKGGNIAHYLLGLYTRQVQLLSMANLENNAKYMEEVIEVTKGLLEAWKDETSK